MDKNHELVDYIKTQREAGYKDADILHALIEQGWDETTARNAMNPVLQHPLWQSGPPVPQQPVADLPQAKPKGKLWLLITVPVFLLIIATIIVLVVVGSKEPAAPEPVQQTETFINFDDQNYFMTLPESWKPDPSYLSGATLTIFGSPEAGDQNAQLKVFVGTATIDRIAQQLQSVTEREHTIIKDETYSDGELEYRYLELVVTPTETPDKKVHIAAVSVKRGEVIINADVVAFDQHWDLHKDEVERILKSLEPKCAKAEQLSDTFTTNTVIKVCSE